jgi:hypothetical protein
MRLESRAGNRKRAGAKRLQSKDLHLAALSILHVILREARVEMTLPSTSDSS